MTTEMEHVGTDVSRPLSPPTSDEEQYSIYSVDDKEITEVSPISTIMMEAKDAEETPAVSISPLEQEAESQEASVGTDVSRPLPPPTSDEDVMNRSLLATDADTMNRSLQTYDEEPLNDLEWLDVISAEQDMPEVQYVPDVADAPPLPEEAWSAEEPVLYDDEASDEATSRKKLMMPKNRVLMKKRQQQIRPSRRYCLQRPRRL